MEKGPWKVQKNWFSRAAAWVRKKKELTQFFVSDSSVTKILSVIRRRRSVKKDYWL